eukprot:scaffold2480_cov122-Isochrysis_galbana.AAC.1
MSQWRLVACDAPAANAPASASAPRRPLALHELGRPRAAHPVRLRAAAPHARGLPAAARESGTSARQLPPRPMLQPGAPEWGHAEPWHGSLMPTPFSWASSPAPGCLLIACGTTG